MVLLGIGGVALIGALAWSFMGNSEPELTQAVPAQATKPKAPREKDETKPKARASREESRVVRTRSDSNRRDRSAVRQPKTDKKDKRQESMGMFD